MPLKASIGLSKKVGLPDYGSLGAHCQLEIELDASLIGDAEAFHERIQRLYALAHQSVVDQLARQSGSGSNGNGNGNGHAKPSSGRNGNGHSGNNGNGRAAVNDDNALASNRQVKFLLDLARQQHKMSMSETGEFCRELVGVHDIYQLTKAQASTIIDRLSGKNGQPNGKR